MGPGRTYVYLSGTLNGNPVAAVAGLATLAELQKPGRYERLREAGERMRKRLAAVFAERRMQAQAVGVGPLFRLVFTDRPIESHRDLLAADRQRATKVGVELLKRGFFVNPGDKAYISLAHSDDDLDGYVAAVAAILDEMWATRWEVADAQRDRNPPPHLHYLRTPISL